MRYVRIWLLLLPMATAIGCGGSEDVLVPVSGTVTLNGKPLAGAEVHFVTAKFEGYGKTNTEGHYELVNGAAPGPNKVYFKKDDPAAAAAAAAEIDMSIEGMDEGQVEAMLESQGLRPTGSEGKVGLIPADYADPETTKLSFPVPAGGTDSADFKLQSE
ncbi:MAG: hypothetical protein KY476_05645 [Planctomycetes bacterium]|nr:hypothetical protein [Planctomycetota bacterium]